jgi:hypothetical protein
LLAILKLLSCRKSFAAPKSQKYQTANKYLRTEQNDSFLTLEQHLFGAKTGAAKKPYHLLLKPEHGGPHKFLLFFKFLNMSSS